MLRKIWHDPVWSTVIATGILIALGAIIRFIPPLWVIAEKAIEVTGLWLLAEHSIQTWALLTLSVPIIFALIIIFINFKNYSQREDEPDWKKYTEDDFGGLKWRWKYSSYDEQIRDLSSFCDKCDLQIIPALSNYSTWLYRCNDCELTYIRTNKRPQDIEQEIILRVQKNIRTGQY